MVVSIHQYPVPEGKSGAQISELLQQRVELMGAKKDGTFCVDCETYTATNITPSRTVNIIHDTDRPASTFALVDSGTCVVADTQLDLLMAKMAGTYNAKKSTRIESKGPKYKYGDFAIKIGSVCMGPSMRGILVEVDYDPCVVPGSCWELMRELMQGFMGNVVQSPTQYLQGRMNEIYTPVDTVHQYMEHFNFFRRTPSTR